MTLLLFGLPIASVWLVLASGVDRWGGDERPAWFWTGIAGCGLWAVASLVIGAARPRWRETSDEVPKWVWIVIGTLLGVAILTGTAYDVVVD